MCTHAGRGWACQRSCWVVRCWRAARNGWVLQSVLSMMHWKMLLCTSAQFLLVLKLLLCPQQVKLAALMPSPGQGLQPSSKKGAFALIHAWLTVVEACHTTYHTLFCQERVEQLCEWSGCPFTCDSCHTGLLYITYNVFFSSVVRELGKNFAATIPLHITPGSEAILHPLAASCDAATKQTGSCDGAPSQPDVHRGNYLGTVPLSESLQRLSSIGEEGLQPTKHMLAAFEEGTGVNARPSERQGLHVSALNASQAARPCLNADSSLACTVTTCADMLDGNWLCVAQQEQRGALSGGSPPWPARQPALLWLQASTGEMHAHFMPTAQPLLGQPRTW